MSSLIENSNNLYIEDMGEPASKLIDKLSDVLEWNVTNWGSHRLAQEMFVDYIRSNDSIPEEIKPALIYNSKKILKEYANQVDVVAYGIELLDEKANIDGINDQWITEFMDGAGKASTDELKYLWGAILASECNDNNSIPKRLLIVLKGMDLDEANAFTKLCSTCVTYKNENGVNEIQPIILGYKEDDGSPIDYNAYVELAALGLIEYDFLFKGKYTINFLNDNTSVYYGEKEYTDFIVNGVFHVGNILLTKLGKALASIVKTEPIPNYIEDYYIPYLDNQRKLDIENEIIKGQQ